MKGLEDRSVTNPISDNPIPPEGTSLVDTHCHLDMREFENDFDMVLNRAKNHGVDSVITIGIDLASSRKAIGLARKYPCIWASVGVHPHDVHSATDETYAAIEDLIETNHHLVVGYGEIGLDYLKKRSEPELQRRHFRRQLEMAKKHRLPAIIHDRDAHEDTIRILHETGPFPNGGVMHCFSGDMDFAGKIVDLGFHISIPGIVTFKNAHDLHEVAQKVPLTSLLVETDGPFLAPHPWRGKRNEPAYVLYTADYIAKLRDIPLVELAKATTANAKSLFRLSTSQPSASSLLL
jgi:TatD DNase family protein